MDNTLHKVDNTFGQRGGPKQVGIQILELFFSAKFLSNNIAIAATYTTASRSGSVKRAQILTIQKTNSGVRSDVVCTYITLLCARTGSHLSNDFVCIVNSMFVVDVAQMGS